MTNQHRIPVFVILHRQFSIETLFLVNRKPLSGHSKPGATWPRQRHVKFILKNLQIRQTTTAKKWYNNRGYYISHGRGKPFAPMQFKPLRALRFAVIMCGFQPQTLLGAEGPLKPQAPFLSDEEGNGGKKVAEGSALRIPVI